MSKTTLLSLPILALAIAVGAAFAQTPGSPQEPGTLEVSTNSNSSSRKSRAGKPSIPDPIRPRRPPMRETAPRSVPDPAFRSP